MSGHDELRALAEAATPGPWKWWNLEREDQGWTNNGPDLMARGDETIIGAWGHDAWGIDVSPEDAAYLAAVSPDVVLALLDEIKQLRGGDRD